jgi:hypothetical protein
LLWTVKKGMSSKYKYNAVMSLPLTSRLLKNFLIHEGVLYFRKCTPYSVLGEIKRVVGRMGTCITHFVNCDL